MLPGTCPPVAAQTGQGSPASSAGPAPSAAGLLPSAGSSLASPAAAAVLTQSTHSSAVSGVG